MPRRRRGFVWVGAPLALLGVGLIASSCAVGAEDASSTDQPDAVAPVEAAAADGSARAEGGRRDSGDDATGATGATGGEDSATGTGDDASGDDGAADADDGSSPDGGEKDAGDGGRKDGGEDAGIVDSGNEHDAADGAPEDAGHDAADAAHEEDAGHDAGDASVSDGSVADAGVDAEPDAGVDSGPDDAGPDTSVDACGATALPVLINEVQTSGPNGADDEWIEIYNPMGCPVDVSGWELRHTSTSGTTIDKVFTAASGTEIAAGGYGVVAGTAYSASAPTIGALSTGVLADTGGGLGLYDATGAIIDTMGYGAGATNPFVVTAPAPSEGTSQSIARIPNGSNTGDDATDFSAASPTPGATN